MVVDVGADPTRCASPALSPVYKTEPHADAADYKIVGLARNLNHALPLLLTSLRNGYSFLSELTAHRNLVPRK